MCAIWTDEKKEKLATVIVGHFSLEKRRLKTRLKGPTDKPFSLLHYLRNKKTHGVSLSTVQHFF